MLCNGSEVNIFALKTFQTFFRGAFQSFLQARWATEQKGGFVHKFPAAIKQVICFISFVKPECNYKRIKKPKKVCSVLVMYRFPASPGHWFFFMLTVWGQKWSPAWIFLNEGSFISIGTLTHLSKQLSSVCHGAAAMLSFLDHSARQNKQRQNINTWRIMLQV